MTMPILPALMGAPEAGAPAAPTLVDIISQLDEEMVTELLTAADAAGFGVTVDDEEPPAETDEEPPVEEVPMDEEVVEDEELPPESEDGEPVEEADAEDEATEEEVGEMAELGYDAIGEWSDKALEQIDAQYDALVELGKAADADLGADPDSIDQLIETADELREQASEARDTCALEALKLERASRILAKLLEQAQAYAETTETPEAGPADDPAMKLWAERTAPKGGPLPL